MATISAWVDDMVGVTGMYLFLRTAAEVLVNVGGDILTDPNSSGLFRCTVAEDLTGLGLLRTRVSTSADENDVFAVGWLAEGSTLVSEEKPVTVPELAGPFTRIITVVDADSALPIEDALVRFYRTSETETKQTDENGEVEFTTIAATWSYAVTAGGYSGATGEIVVTASGSTEIELAPIYITPSVGSFTTGFLIAYDGQGAVEPGAIIYCEMVSKPPSDMGSSYDSEKRDIVAATITGLVSIPGLAKGASYRIWRGIRPAVNSNIFVIPTSAGSTYELPSHIGRE